MKKPKTPLSGVLLFWCRGGESNTRRHALPSIWTISSSGVHRRLGAYARLLLGLTR